MKLTEKIQSHLIDHYQEVLIFDERGDGHFIQIICIDPQFENKNLLKKSREIYKHLENFQSQVHAWSVKGFTPEEWEIKKPEFELIRYEHYPK